MAPILSTLRPLRAGDVIIDAKPVFHIVYNDFKGRHCDYCLQYSTSLEMCFECKEMYYCDQNCQNMDWKQHQNECPILATNTYQTTPINWIERLLLRLWVCLRSDPTLAIQKYRLIDGSEVCLNDIEVQIEEQNGIKSIASTDIIDYIFEFNQICKHFEEYQLDYDRKELFEWYGVIAASPISYSFRWYSYDMFIGTKEDSYPAFVGQGLYPQLWSVRHSCLPNSAVVTNGLSLQLRAMKSMAVGTQITRSYVRLNQCKYQRKRDLKRYYFLDCNCEKCKQNDFDADYREYEYLRKIMETDFDFNDLYSNPKVKDWEHSLSVINKVVKLEKTIFRGQYHPSRTFTLLRQMMSVRWWGRLTRKTTYWIPWSSQTKYKKIETHVRITYGVDHPIYRKFFRERVSYL